MNKNNSTYSKLYLLSKEQFKKRIPKFGKVMFQVIFHRVPLINTSYSAKVTDHEIIERNNLILEHDKITKNAISENIFHK